MKSAIVDAFIAASDGFSPNRIVADPGINERFIAECRAKGLTESITALNQFLLNLRKSGGLSGVRKSRRTEFSHQDEYRFAAEMAVRFLERRDGVNLDQIICDPQRASEFDALAAKVAPGYSSLQYRWAALYLRKSSRLEPELLARIAPPVEVLVLTAEQLTAEKLPAKPGLYLLFDSKQLLYVGETENLKKRLIKHLDHSDNKHLARWLWEFGAAVVKIEIQVLADNTSTRVRKALETELIRSRKPAFNVKR